MKKILTLILVMGFSLTLVNAQDAKEVKLNVLGAVFNNYTLGYEHALSETGSVGIWINYQSYDIVGDEDNTLSGIGFIPEYRFYFSPDDQIDGFFAGPYLKYGSFTSKGGSYFGYEDGSSNDLVVYDDVKATTSRFVLGLNLGRKWVTDGGFMFETSLGFGKALADGVKYDNDNVDKYREDEGIELIDVNIDLRLGISVGWRF